MPGIGNFLQMLVALGFIIVLANYLLKKLNGINQVRSKAIKIIERVPVSKSSSLCIVQIGSQYMLMSFSEHGNEVIKEFTKKEKEEIQQRIYQESQVVKNSTDLKKMTGSLKDQYGQLKEKYEQTFKKD